LKRHSKLSHTSRNCQICWTLLPSPEVLRRHMKERHSDASEDKKFACDACDFKTHQKVKLERHARLSHSKYSYDCSSCQRSFSEY
jgi:DNA-directed RNA polymerase subunit RPC12/RpoP